MTGLGFEPQGVIFIGANKATVGSLVTGLSSPGVFVSINARKWDAPGTVQSFSLAPMGNSDANTVGYRGIENGPISMPADGGNANVVDYKASAITFDTDGFTLTVATAAPGTRPVHWFAWGGDIVSVSGSFPMQTAFVKQEMQFISPTFDAGFEAWSAMVLSTIGSNGFGEGGVNGSGWLSFGTGHYPEVSVGDAQLWLASAVYTQIEATSPLGRQGFTNYFVFDGPSATDWSFVSISHVLGTLGPLLTEGYRRHRPDAGAGSQQIFINEGGGSQPTFQGCAWWNSEGTTGIVTVPGGGSVTVGAPFNFSEYEQVMFSTINGASGSGNATPFRYGFGMLGVDDQGCCVFGQDGSFYQSNTECAANCSAAGYVAASGVINGPSFTLTSTHGGDLTVTYHAWGKATAGWMPQMYRWQPATRRSWH